MEHHQEVSPVGYSVASWKTHTNYSVIGVIVLCVIERNVVCVRAHQAEQIIPSWGKSDTRRKRPVQASREAKNERVEEKRSSLGGLLMSFSEEWSKKRGGSGEQTIALSLFPLPPSLSVFLSLFPFKVFIVASRLTLAHKAYSLQCVALSSAVLPLLWHHGAAIVFMSLGV